MARRAAAAVAPPADDLSPHLVPPAPAWSLARLGPLLELPPALGLALWRAAHDVPVWLGLSAGARGQACQRPTERVRARFAAARSEAPELAGALDTLWALLCEPAAMEPARLADALGAAAAWAEERGLLPAAIPLAEAAAAVQPESAARCNVAGRVCRRTAEHTRAEQWYDRGIGLAKRSGSAKDYIDAQLGLGALLHSLGAYQAARKHYLRGARRAQRFGRRRIAGETYHELMGLAAEVGPTQSVVEYARLALANYRVNEPLLPTLAHDYSFALVRGEHFSVALPLLEIVVPLLVRPGDRLIGLSTLTRAVAGAGDPSRFDALSAEVRAQVRDGMEYAAAALINLAEGAALLQRPNQAESLAGEAARIAHARKDAAAERIAFALVERIRNGRARPEVTLPLGSQLAAVATEFLLRLRRWRGPDVPRQAGRRESGPPR